MKGTLVPSQNGAAGDGGWGGWGWEGEVGEAERKVGEARQAGAEGRWEAGTKPYSRLEGQYKAGQGRGG